MNINYIIGQKPVQVCAMNSKQIMKGNKPAGLKGEDCPEQYTCKEGPSSTMDFLIAEKVVKPSTIISTTTAITKNLFINSLCNSAFKTCTD